ncbi:MAG: type IV secretion system DNA-binding domain-containing protein [Rickettsiales bacterium]|nr:type IV secretion system DNA-binding domain-containing protein [Rickettsiales bacterium]
MSNFIRGSQVTLHLIRMFWQALKVLLAMSIIWITVAFCYGFWKHTTLNDWHIFIKKSINGDITKVLNPNKLIEFKTPHGTKLKVMARFFEDNYYVKHSLIRVNKGFELGVTISLFGVGVMTIFAIIFFCWRGKTLKRNKNLRGSFLISIRQLKRSIRKHNKRFKDYKPCEIVGIPYVGQGSKYSYTSGEQSHTLLVGATGSGKTKIIKDLLMELHKRKQKAIIIDVKGDYIKNFYCKSAGGIILNPMDERGANWNIWKETDPLKGFLTIAKGLLPKDSKLDPVWNQAARLVFAEMAKMYWNAGLSLSEFADVILKTDIKTLEKLLANSPANKTINTGLEKAALSVLMVLSNDLTPMKLYRSNKDCFSITEWVQDASKGGFLFISSLADAKADLNPIISAQVSIAVNAIRSLREDSNTPKVWFILDELSDFSDPISGLQDGLTMARSSGGCFVLGTQDMSSLDKIYSHQSVKTIANNCKTKLFLSVDSDAAEWCSRTLGEGEVEEWHEGLQYGANTIRDGVSVNRSKTMRRAVLAGEFTNLKTGEGYIKMSGFNPAHFKSGRFSWFANIAKPFVENKALVEVLTKEIKESQKRRRAIENKLNLLNAGGDLDKDFSLFEASFKKKGNQLKSDRKIKEIQESAKLGLKIKPQTAIQLKQQESCLDMGSRWE